MCPRPSPRELDGVTQPKSDVTKDRQQRRLLIRRRLPFAGSTNVVYPPVNFLANGKPGKIFVNGAEYQCQQQQNKCQPQLCQMKVL